MANQEKSNDSLFNKVGSLFGTKEEANANEVVEAKVMEENFFSGLKNRLFGDKVEDVIDVEAFEIVTADMELVVTEQEVNQEGIVVTTTEVVAMEQLEHQTGIFASLADTATNTLASIKNTAIGSWDFTTNTLNTAKNATVTFSTETANSLVHFGKGIGKKYDEIELSPKFYSFVKAIDLLVVINALELCRNKQKKGTKEFVAISTVIAILFVLERSKDKSKELVPIEGTEEMVNQDLSTLLKSITIKDVIETVEPVLLFIPNGNYILLILRLFV
ncbi:MAG: hypothetical protein LBE34_03815 [Flavobacteriaceae bacterium]|nr:hypothetical protein [Flavobacteriaceae bacterium]